tara:strand:- start:1175 stop:1753 length:579 start_codon:yes stop_codon:yes gene_type:complete
MPLLVGTDGVQKMSKSLNNYIGVDEPPSDMYGKIMSIPDNLIMNYLELTTSTSKQDLEQINNEMQAESVNPMDIKKMLAKDIVSQFHDEASARESELTFVRTVQQGSEPEDVKTLLVRFSTDSENPSKSLTINFVDLITTEKLASSKSEAKRLISQNAVSINGVVSNTETNVVGPNDIIRVGRRRFLKIVEG